MSKIDLMLGRVSLPAFPVMEVATWISDPAELGTRKDSYALTLKQTLHGDMNMLVNDPSEAGRGRSYESLKTPVKGPAAGFDDVSRFVNDIAALNRLWLLDQLAQKKDREMKAIATRGISTNGYRRVGNAIWDIMTHDLDQMKNQWKGHPVLGRRFEEIAAQAIGSVDWEKIQETGSSPRPKRPMAARFAAFAPALPAAAAA